MNEPELTQQLKSFIEKEKSGIAIDLTGKLQKTSRTSVQPLQQTAQNRSNIRAILRDIGALLYRIAASKKPVFSLPNRSKVRSKRAASALEVDPKRCEKDRFRFDRVRCAFGIYFVRIPHSIRIVLGSEGNIY